MVSWRPWICSGNRVRRHYRTWTIKKDIRDNYGIKDGMYVPIKLSVRYNKESLVVHTEVYKITSGGEFGITTELGNKISGLVRSKLGDHNNNCQSFNGEFSLEFSLLELTEIDEYIQLVNDGPEEELTERVITVIVRPRDPQVVQNALEIASGYCQCCEQKAPFNRRTDGSPYLEVHHIIPLAEGGEDIIDNVIAVCPNCHRELHFG